MRPARSEPDSYNRTRRQTAESNGCLSGFLLPPLAALFVGSLLAVFVLGFTDAPGELPAAPLTDRSPTGGATLSPLFTPEIQFWSASLSRWASQNELDVNLAATVMQIESCGDPQARSSAGAIGLFQVMPFHFLGSEEPYDPETNARRGLDYLHRSLLAAGGDARLALAGYNGGVGVINWPETEWPAQTVRYVRWGYGIYSDAAQQRSQSASLDDWLTVAGRGLCAQAAKRLGISP